MNNFTDDEKRRIAAKIKSISREEAIQDFLNLRRYKPNGSSSNIGNKCVDYFTFVERLNTVGKKGLSYFDVLANIDESLLRIPSCGRFILYQSLDRPDNCEEKVVYAFKRLFYGSIGSFKASIAAEIYDEYKPSSILDPFAGFGGRCIAAMSRDIDYTGFDTNKRLTKGYFDMICLLQPHTYSRTEIYFKDALEIDYNVLRDYDMVFSSPPYYNIEMYNGMERRTIEEWNVFYRTVFSRSWKHLQKNGYFVLNINKEIYETVAVPLLGYCYQQKIMGMSRRSRNSTYEEFIYIWKKED